MQKSHDDHVPKGREADAQKRIELLQIILANAFGHPWAVMIPTSNTYMAKLAMQRSPGLHNGTNCAFVLPTGWYKLHSALRLLDSISVWMFLQNTWIAQSALEKRDSGPDCCDTTCKKMKDVEFERERECVHAANTYDHTQHDQRKIPMRTDIQDGLLGDTKCADPTEPTIPPSLPIHSILLNNTRHKLRLFLADQCVLFVTVLSIPCRLLLTDIALLCGSHSLWHALHAAVRASSRWVAKPFRSQCSGADGRGLTTTSLKI